AVDPQTVRDHPLPKRLDARAQAVTRGELLRRERGAEIGIVLPDQRQNGAPECLAMSAIARATAFAGNQARCAIDGEGTTQPENLAPAQTHQRRGGLDCEPAVCQVEHDRKPGQFLTAHLDHRHRTSPRTSRRQPASVTSLSGTYGSRTSSERSAQPSMNPSRRARPRAMVLGPAGLYPLEVYPDQPPGRATIQENQAKLPCGCGFFSFSVRPSSFPLSAVNAGSCAGSVASARTWPVLPSRPITICMIRSRSA